MYVIFNELCEKIGLSQQNPKEKMDQFIAFLIDVWRQNIIEGIVATNDLFELGRDDENYSFQSWLNDSAVDQEYKRFLCMYLGKYINYIEAIDVDGEFYVDIGGRNHIGIGCTFAHEAEDILISRATHDIWKEEYVNGIYSSLDENGEIISIESSLININELVPCKKLKKIALDHVFANISSGYDLWDCREELYPNLIFCDSVKVQLYADPERFHIIKIMERLNILQNYFSQKHDFYQPKELGASARTESETVKNDPDLKKYRLFELPTGEQVYFYDHIGFTGKFSAGRIHFYPMVQEQKCYIGYIGRHLPTKNF